MSLERTFAAYVKAYSRAHCPFDLASNARDIADTSWKIANQIIEHEAEINPKVKKQVLGHFKEAVSHYDQAVLHGAKCDLSEEWTDSLKASFHESLQDVKFFIGSETDDFEERISILETFKPLINNFLECKADICVELATQMFRLGVIKLQDGDYKAALNWMKKCYQPVEEARKWAGDQHDILVEVNILKEDIFLVECKAQSLQSRETGDALLEKSLKEEEELNMTAIYEVMDWYKRAILLAKEIEIEMEAVAQSQLGKVYAEVLKIPYKAKEYFVRCIHLAHSLHPRTFYSVDWFQTATIFVETYQKERLEQETDRWQEERKQYMDELKDELKALKEQMEKRGEDKVQPVQKDVTFLKFIYDSHPPKSGHRLPTEKEMLDMERSEMKSLYKSAVIRYHPDRNKKHGKKWQTLCEEIEKSLTFIYESYK